jgi:hypothetical protein
LASVSVNTMAIVVASVAVVIVASVTVIVVIASQLPTLLRVNKAKTGPDQTGLAACSRGGLRSGDACRL